MECERKATADLSLRMARDVPGSNLHRPTFQPPLKSEVNYSSCIPKRKEKYKKYEKGPSVLFCGRGGGGSHPPVDWVDNVILPGIFSGASIYDRLPLFNFWQHLT